MYKVIDRLRKLAFTLNDNFEVTSPKHTYTNIFLSLINSSTADKLPKIWFMIIKKNAPTL